MSLVRAAALFILAAPTITLADRPAPSAPQGKPAGFQFGDLIDISKTITSYFAGARAEGEAPTYLGLETAIRGKYQDAIRDLHALEDQSTVNVDVRHDDKTHSVLVDVSFEIRKVNQTAAAHIDLSQASRHFTKGSIPTRFRVEISGAYRLGIRGADGLEDVSAADAMRNNVFFLFDHLTMNGVASGPEQDDGMSDGFDPFPAGLPVQAFSLDALEFAASPDRLRFTYEMGFQLRAASGKAELSGSDMADRSFVVTAAQRSACGGAFTLIHRHGAGTLTLIAENDDLAKGPNAALSLHGTMTFKNLLIGETPLSNAALTFSGAADQAQIRATMREEDLLKLGDRRSRGSGLKADAAGHVTVDGRYDFPTHVLTLQEGRAPLELPGAISLKAKPD